MACPIPNTASEFQTAGRGSGSYRLRGVESVGCRNASGMCHGLPKICISRRTCKQVRAMQLNGVL